MLIDLINRFLIIVIAINFRLLMKARFLIISQRCLYLLCSAFIRHYFHNLNFIYLVIALFLHLLFC